MDDLHIGPDLAANLPECAVGDTKTLTVTGTVTEKGEDGSLSLSVEAVDYAGEHAAEDDGETYQEEKPTAKPMKKKAMAPAVMVLLGKGK